MSIESAYVFSLRCRIETATGFKTIEAAQKRALTGSCPLIGREYYVPITQPKDSHGLPEEISAKLPLCDTCGLRAQAYDFKYIRGFDPVDEITRADFPDIPDTIDL